MIKSIFESQFKKASVNILDSPLIHSDGCYLCGYFNIISNDETLSLSEFKNHYSKRYEKAKRNSLFINELKELKELAQQNLEFYNNELTEKSKIVKEFYKNLPTEYVEKQAYLNEHSALVVLLNLNVSDIKFGSNLNWSVQLNHCFTSTNEDLSIICTNIIQFIDKLEFEEVKEVVLNELESKELEKENKTCYTEIGETLSKYLIDNKITIDVAALYCVYQSIEVTEHNGKEIILHFKNTSGRKLYQRFSFFNTTENRRITDLHSKTKLNNRIKQITKLLDLLEENYKIHAQKDLDFLRKKFDEDYG